MDPSVSGCSWNVGHLDDIRSHDIYTVDKANLQFPQFSPPDTPIIFRNNSASSPNKRQLGMDQSIDDPKRFKMQQDNFRPTGDKDQENPDSGPIIDNFTDDDSWVDLSKHVSPLPPSEEASGMRIRCAAEECLRLLREAQKESNSSSVNASQASSRVSRSPKSPPNSPNNELAEESDTSFEELVQSMSREGGFSRRGQKTDSDWIWDWSSRPYQTPPKQFRFVHPVNAAGGHGASIRKVMIGKASLFSKEVLYTLVITNVLSILIGAGIGLWWSKRSSGTFIIGSFPLD